MKPVSLIDLHADVHTALKLWHKANDDTSPLDGLYLFRRAERNHPGKARLITNELLLDGLAVMARDYDPDLAELLRLRFVEIEPMHRVSARLNQAEATLNRKQRQAIEGLADILHRQELQARAEAMAALEKQLDLPTETELIGVESTLNQVVDILLSERAGWLIALVGLGGIGKTALAGNVVRQLALSGRFEQAAWVSAKQQEFWPGLGVQPLSKAPALKAATLVEALLDQLVNDPVQHLPHAQKLALLSDRLKATSHFIVIDNLETVQDYEALLPLLQQLANPTKFLLTTRHLVPRSDVTSFRLDELDQADTFALLRHEATVRHMPALQAATEADLERIHAVVGGNPLALRLVVGQLSALSLTAVLDNLKAAQGQENDEFFTYIYRQAWEQLAEPSRQLLLVMPLAQHGDLDQLATAGDLAAGDLSGAVQQLTAFSLLDVSGRLDERRYSIHRLTETFLMNEIIDQWQATL